MNSNKKKLFAVALAVCLVSILSFSTLAWFNASESVTNKFMVASTGTGESGQSKPDKVFSIDLWEKVDSDGDGDVDADDTKVNYRDNALTGWTYEDILPGVKYHKEPTVENTGSYDQYVRVVVTVSNAAKWQTILPADYPLGTIFHGHNEDKWTYDPDGSDAVNAAAAANNEDTLSYVYYLDEKLAPGATAVVFEQVQLPSWLTQDDVAKLAVEDNAGNVTIDFKISVRADAIQTEGLGDTVATAKDAFASINWTSDKTYTQAMTPSTNP